MWDLFGAEPRVNLDVLPTPYALARAGGTVEDWSSAGLGGSESGTSGFGVSGFGVYDMSGVQIAHSGATAPLGDVTVTKDKETLKIEGSTAILLRVIQ